MPTIGVEYELKKYTILDQEFHLQMYATMLFSSHNTCLINIYNILFVLFNI